jgi:tetratricopeptide (TPR) repeat protein
MIQYLKTMGNSKKIWLLVCTILFLGLFACKNNKSKPNPELASINLLRGELLLCSTESFGEVDFSLSCSYETRETFNLAISLLHSFEYEEAEKAFVKVIDMDPDCAMAYWGVSMSIFHSLWMQSDLSYLEKGEKLMKLTNNLPKSDLEKDYLDAISFFYTDWENTDKLTRQRMYEKKMEALYNKHKDDTEAAVFYALAIRAAADPNDKDYTRQLKSGKILENLFEENPNHPGIAHYIIHNYDYPELAEMALSTARRYAEIAPASAHAQHMPSHIFTRLGLWDESITTNIKSAFSATCYAANVDPNANWAQEIHAVDYLVYAYLQKGNNEEALKQLIKMQAVKDVFPKNDFAASYALVAIPVRFYLETKQWEKASKLELPTINFPWENLHWEKAMLHFGRALGFSNTGNILSAENELETLKTLYQDLLDSDDAYKSGQVMVQIQAAEGWIQLAKGNKDMALSFMKKAAELEGNTTKHPVTPGEVLPADELLGDMLLALNNPVEALQAYEADLEGHPNRFNGVYGAAIAAEQSGNKEKAMAYFKALLTLSENSNSDRLEIVEAKMFIEKYSSI